MHAASREKNLKHSTHTNPWSPILVFVILEVQLWKLISSTITNKHNTSNPIETVISRMRLLSVSLRPNPIERENKNIVRNIKTKT